MNGSGVGIGVAVGVGVAGGGIGGGVAEEHAAMSKTSPIAYARSANREPNVIEENMSRPWVCEGTAAAALS